MNMIKCHKSWFLHPFQELVVKHLLAHHRHHISYVILSSQQLCKVFIRMHGLKMGKKRHQLHKQQVQIFLENKKRNQVCVSLFPVCFYLYSSEPGLVNQVVALAVTVC